VMAIRRKPEIINEIGKNFLDFTLYYPFLGDNRVCV